MPRKPRIFDPMHPYHICVRGVHQRPFILSPEKLWPIFEDFLFLLAKGFDAEIYAFVMMSNHFHLLAKFPENNMSLAMNHFLRETSKEMNRVSGRVDQNFGNRYYPCLIDNEFYLSLVYRYIYQNPVRARICRDVLDYPYSTLAMIFGIKKCMIPVTTDAFFQDLHFKDGGIEWLNQPPDLKETQIVREALQMARFRLKRDRVTGLYLGLMPLLTVR